MTMTEQLHERVQALELELAELKTALESQGIIERPGTSGEVVGYAFWGIVLGAVAFFEILAAVVGALPWPTLTAIFKHLETESELFLLVIALLYARSGSPSGPVAQGLGEVAAHRRVVPGILYFPLAVVGTTITILVVAALTDSKWYLGYALYGSVAAVSILLPNSLAYWFGFEVPFPTFSQTLRYWERRDAYSAKLIRLMVGTIRPPSRL